MIDRTSSGSDDSDTSSGDESSQPATELMITTRERRTTAGNRYSQLVAQEDIGEDAEDDVALLFAEAEGEDEEYNSDEADDEADMSSSDDDDQGPDAGADELEGEQEIQKQAKIERQKKRKADMALTTMSGIKKKPKIDPTSLHRAPDKPKPSKRKERVSWLPVSDAAPGRTSLRKQTVAHREVMLERLKENEELRLKNKAQRERKEKLKQAEAPKELTQADRLAEAARNERRNAKSLNRWEAREKERAEEQAARLAALKERKLDGAVLTTYSAAHVYYGPKVEHESSGPGGTDEVPVKRKYQRKSKLPIAAPAPVGFLSVTDSAQMIPGSSLVPATAPATPTKIESEENRQKMQGAKQDNNRLLAGIHEYALMKSAGESQDSQPIRSGVIESLTSDIQAPTTSENPKESTSGDGQKDLVQSETEAGPQTEPKPPVIEIQTSATVEKVAETPPGHTSGMENASTAVSASVTSKAQNAYNGAGETLNSLPIQVAQSEAVPSSDGPLDLGTGVGSQNHAPKIEVLSTRNLVILDRFDELGINERRNFAVLYNTKKNGKLPKVSTEYCPITGQIAKYRDPVSDVGYANMTAYKKLREAQKHEFCWSSMLGCYVGRAGHVARGVPEGFLG